MKINIWMIAIVATMSLGASRCEKRHHDDDAGGVDPGPGDGDGDGDVGGDGDGDVGGDGDGDVGGDGDGDGDVGGDGDGDVGGVVCGPSTCAEGRVCCNESCGICTEPDGFCTDQFCGDPDPTSPTCGGFLGIECPGAGMCVDDPSDDCDPANGGADCSGVCDCSGALVLCITGTWFNEDPNVCECVPVDGDGEACGPNTCAEGQVCCNESCGICTEPGGGCTKQYCGDPDPMAPACGGFAGFTCPGEGECFDDPSDDCDPENGGADCGGLCECNVGPLIDCARDHVFDDSPEVCACVPVGGDECGNVTCGEGLVCCNASCGMCAAPDEACIQIACL